MTSTLTEGATPIPALEARSLTKSYGGHRGIVDVNLQVIQGEVMGLVGANGAGKTTLMRTALDFIRPNSGTVTVCGFDSVRDSIEVRRRVAYLPGEVVLPPRLRGQDVLRRFAAARPALDTERVRTLADRLNLDLSRPTGELSKGNRQKIGLVLAFAFEVDLFVLDEPTSGLDPLLQREFAALVAERVGAGATVLLSSHVMSEIEQIASRVALVRDGRIAAVDTLDGIRARSRRRGRVRPLDPTDLQPLADALRQRPGVSEVAISDHVVTFACAGLMDPVLKTLAGFDVAALDVAHADLEDAFFSAYNAPVSERLAAE